MRTYFAWSFAFVLFLTAITSTSQASQSKDVISALLQKKSFAKPVAYQASEPENSDIEKFSPNQIIAALTTADVGSAHLLATRWGDEEAKSATTQTENGSLSQSLHAEFADGVIIDEIMQHNCVIVDLTGHVAEAMAGGGDKKQEAMLLLADWMSAQRYAVLCPVSQTSKIVDREIQTDGGDGVGGSDDGDGGKQKSDPHRKWRLQKTPADLGNSLWSDLTNSSTNPRADLITKLESNIAGASVSVRDDQIKHEDDISLVAALGFVVSTDDTGAMLFSSVDWEKNTDNKTGLVTKNSPNVNNLSAGVAVEGNIDLGKIPLLSGDEFQWSVIPRYTTDTNFKEQIGYLYAQLGLLPDNTDGGWLLSCFSAAGDVDKTYNLKLLCGASIAVDMAYTWNGGDSKLMTGTSYFRAGGSFVAALDYEPKDVPAIKSLLLGLHYISLKDFSTNNKNLSRTEVGLFWTPGGAASKVSVGLKYINGEADVTLQKERFWQLTLNGNL